ncbi:MAG: V-type ATP synthase subunit E family protein [Polyangiales bacterium]
MAASDLDTELRTRAETTAASILSAAQAETARLASEADLVIADRRRKVLKDKEDEYGSEARIAIASERHAAMRAVLLARTRVVHRVLERVRALLPEAAARQSYLLGLSAELTEALQFVERDGAVVRCSVDLASILREALRAQPEIKVQPVSDLGTGFIVVGRGESVLVDARLDARVDSLASVLAIEIHTLLGEA